jgi:quercetin dioxygenase-like cupin family protein/DNA-binding Xre family transcriptional regulator
MRLEPETALGEPPSRSEIDALHRSGGGSSSIRPVGHVLRDLRVGRRLTLKAVAEKAGVSESFLSQLERDRVGTSLKSLQAVAGALRVEVGALFENETNGPVRLVRPGDQERISIGSVSKAQLTPMNAAYMEAFTGTFEPGGTMGEPYTHGDSEEIFLVLSGHVIAEVDGETYGLSPGDSLFYRSSVPHTFHASADGPAEVLWVISPPSI